MARPLRIEYPGAYYHVTARIRGQVCSWLFSYQYRSDDLYQSEIDLAI